MTISYTGKLAALEEKFSNIAEKFQKIMDLNQSKSSDEIFARNLLDPRKALTEQEKEEVSSFVKNACDKGMKSEVRECKSKDVLKERVLLSKIKELVSDGLIDSDSYKNKNISYEEQIEHLEYLLSSAMDALLYSEKYPEVGDMNSLIREFTESVSSLFAEFRTLHTDREFGIKHGIVHESFDSDFKKTSETLKSVWANRYESKSSALAVASQDSKISNAIAAYTGGELKITKHMPEFHHNPRIDSKEAVENLDNKAYSHLISAIGTMQIAYFKNIALPYLIKGVCALGNTKVGFDSQIKDHTAFSKAKYVMANFKTIFEGMYSDYHTDLLDLYEDLQNIRIKTDGVSSYDLDTFFDGIKKLITLIGYAEAQHEDLHNSSGIETIVDLCPGLVSESAVPSLIGHCTEDNPCEQ